MRKEVETRLSDKAKVLVIDDDADVLDAMALLLESRGYDVLTAATPEDGSRQLEEARPDVVVLDVMMPEGTEGFHWVWKIRQHADPVLREVPVIVVTSIHSTTKFRFHPGDADESGSYLPVQGLLDKPVDPDKLAEKIENILGRGR